ncbi:uncharacterized protein LOC123560994 isoform X2 [Mercenaria mercenaria]|uniref:uncharacterized protein LOC123560994 isoform X2 n=1 Tax=Mercenaria mercenaria TaxID=6596 RepID=UPI00234E8EC3|nr:uncharacterized protein LOC123560994 isoform X2 [Mercenaria mercenaria]
MFVCLSCFFFSIAKSSEMKLGYFFLLLVLTRTVCSYVSTRCPVRWLERPEGNSCYRFWPTRMKSWKEARATCQARDGDLLKLNSKHEKAWIINEIEKYPVHYEWWIGLQRHPGNDSIWLWTDGTTRNETGNFIPWGSGEPNNYGDSEDCAEIWDNLLNDKNCDQPLQFICERPKDLPMKCDVDNGWDEIDSENCFKFFSDKVTQSEAISTCSQDDAYLITINDDSAQQRLKDFLDHEDKATVWLGFQFDTRSSSWFSISRYEASNNWWMDGAPDSDTVVHNDTFCAVIDTSASGIKNWKPENCDASHSVMCWKQPGSCQYGYIKHKTTCYLLNTQDFATWNEARGFCNLRSTKLLEIKNDNDWYYMLTLLKDHYSLTEIKSVWLGLSGKDINKIKWDSGDEVGDFEKGKSNEKLKESSTDTQCGFIDSSKMTNVADGSRWKLGDCSDSRGVVCTVPVNQAVITPPTQKPKYECPEGYTLNGIKCYRRNPDDPVDWYSAREKCANEGADLVTIQSEEDQQYLSSFIQSETWIGLNDRRKEGSFKWLDATAEVNYQYWLESQPNNVQIGSQYSENCVSMIYLPGEENHGKWSDYPCSYKARFVCQTPAEWNIALGKIATQSSIRQVDIYRYSSYGYDNDYGTEDSDDIAQKAIDECSTRSVQSSACCARTDSEDNPWWMLDLGTYYPVGKIVIHRRSEEPHVCSDCISQFRNFRLFISNSSNNSTDESNMVYQEQRDHIPAIIVLNLNNVTVGRYIRIDIPRKGATLVLCEVKVYEGKSLQRAVTPGNSNCITDSTKWAGDIRHTVSGKTCQRWIENVPHNHGYHDKTFPDGTEKDAENLCRDPLGEGQPWCYTTDPDVRWEFCPVPHCITEVGSVDSEMEGEESNCGFGWEEDPNTGHCYWLGDETLTWADAKSVCESVGASLPLPTSKEGINLITGQLFDKQSGLFWLNVYFEILDGSWVSAKDHVPSYILDKLGRSSPSKTMCAITDESENIQSKSCFERNVYICVKSGNFIKYRTSSDEQDKQVPKSIIEKITDGSITTYSMKFEFKGSDGATMFLNQTIDEQINNGYIVRIGGKISPKSSIFKLGSDKPKHSAFIPNLCEENEYKQFWMRWTSGKSGGDLIEVGRGSDIGRNMFMQWADPAGITASSVSVATVTKTSTVYKGYWRFKEDIKDRKQFKTEVNLALGKTTKQSSPYEYFSGPEKAVDGCKSNTYSSQCISHTSDDFEPWWEVDLGKVYPIRKVMIYRRGPECCAARLGYFRLILSILSDSTLEDDVVFKSEDREPPFVMNIPTNGKHARYVKIDIPGRKEYLELAEVEVYEDIDASRCGAGWLDREKDASCYKFSEVGMRWQVAKDFCDAFSSAMVVPKSPTEQLFLYELSLPISESGSVWLGVHDMDSEGTFTTTDGSSLIYTDWGNNEPNNYGGTEDCASLRIDLSPKAGKWNDKKCDTILRAVCKKEELPATTTTKISTTTATSITTTTTVTETPIIVSQGACDSGWVFSPMSSSCLRAFMDSSVNFYNAATKCMKVNSHLASIKNSEEQNLIAEILENNNIVGKKWQGLWTAGFDEHEEGDWKWFMDSITWDSNIRWTPGEPNNWGNGEDCAMIRTASSNYAEINDASCDDTRVVQGYMCKYNLDVRKCKDGWIYNGETDTCYKYELESPETWNDARKKCNEDGGTLATIAMFVTNSNVKGAWVGAHGMHDETFQWIDGSTWIRGLWAPNQPNNWNGNQDCAMIVVNVLPGALGLLQDDFCEDKYPYICAVRNCKTGWEKFEKNCYLFSLLNLGWEDAKTYCESEGASLLIVEDTQEHNYIRQKVRGLKLPYMWIGARYDSKYGEHRWIDGSAMTVDGWAPGKPDSVRGCVDYLNNVDYLWNSHPNCVNTKGPFICEKVSVSEAGLTVPPTTVVSSTALAVQTATTPTTSLQLTTRSITSTSLSQTTEKGKCKLGWEKEYASSETCYKFVTKRASWTEAQAACLEEGGNLISIVSDQEQSYIEGRLQGFAKLPDDMWIGASDRDYEAGWKWIDEQPFEYQNWRPGEPNDYGSAGEDCAAISVRNKKVFGLWNDLPCHLNRGYICKLQVDGMVAPTSTQVPVTEGKCGIGWEKDPSSDTCYKFEIELASWTEAQTKCLKDDGNLVSIISDQEQSYIAGILQGISMLPEAMWIGASDIDFEAGWKWIDGQPFAYLNWARGEPNYYEVVDTSAGTVEGEDCAAIVTADKQLFGQWKDLPCSGKRGHICKRKVNRKVTAPLKPVPDIEDTEIVDIYQKPEAYIPDFKSHDLYEMGVRPIDTFRFSVKTKHDAHILLQNKKTDFTDDVYLVIIGGWGGTKSTISRASDIIYYEQTGLLSQYEYRWFWISWNETTIAVGKSDQVGNDVFLTYSGEIDDINYVSVGTAQYTDAYWKIPKGDKYYGCSGAGWLGYRDACFLVVEEKKDWNEANSYCHKEGAELASIADEQEQRFLFSQLPQDSYCFNSLQNDTKCNILAERGECERNPVWMATHCHLACKHCMHNCRDKYHSSPKCLEWTRLGECDKNPKWMIQNCAMSCGVCQGAPTRGYWIGLQSSGMDQSYRWSDRSNVRFTNWNSHQPLWFNLRPRSCVAMYIQNGKWNDGECSDPLSGFICKQAKMVLPITTQPPFEIGCSMENGYGYGAYCYVYVKEQKSWSDAQKNCNSLGGYLAYIGDAYIQAFVASELQNLLQDYWIGLYVTKGYWTWDGRLKAKLTMTHFDKNVTVAEVRDGCFAMSTNKPVGLWKLYPDCSVTLPSICQVPREGFTTTSPTTTLSSTTPLPSCADTWQPYGQYCYKISDKAQQWHVAQKLCIHYGSSLVSIHDNLENTAVAEMAGQQDPFWIGLHDTEVEGVFIWDDGSPNDFDVWNTNEPNNANNGEDCAEILTVNKLWNDANCFKAKRYICKIPRGKAVNEELPTIDSFPACNENSPDDGWVTFGENCYFLGKEELLTWHAAKMYCSNKGSTLASVHSEEEQRFLSGLNSKTEYVSWIGFNDLDLDNRFSWSDGSVVDYTAWASGQPNDIWGGEKCVPIHNDGTWHDYPCNDRKPFICKKRKVGYTMTTIARTTKSMEGGCPSGFNYTFGNKCYLFSVDGDTTFWGDAKDRCEILGGHIISIHSEQEKDFIALNVYGISHGMWLGMQDLNDDRRFDWSDNSPLDYSNWAPNEPSSNVHDTFEKESCVEMWADENNLGFWNDVKCYASKGYICSAFKGSSLPVLESQCPEGYMFLRKSCYKVLSTKQSWNQSLESCSNEGGHMISIVEVPDGLIIKVLLAISGQDEVWIGGQSLEGNVQWNDGSNSPVTVPHTVRSGCLYSSGASWSSAPCRDNRASVCVINTELGTVSSTTSSTVKSTLSSTVATTHTFTCRNSSWLLYNGFCYTTVFDLKTFPNTKCSKYGMDLASINSAEENHKIIRWILKNRRSNSLYMYPYFWIGLSLQTGNLPADRWTDGSSLVFSNIDRDKGGSKQGCVILKLFTGQWQVVSCTDKHFYVCKGPADVLTTLTPPSTTFTNVGNKTKNFTSTTRKVQLPQFADSEKLAKEETGLSGGQVAGVVIGVLGLLVIIGVVVYILRSWTYKRPENTFEAPSLGFDNALFHKDQDSVDIN